MLSSNYYIIRLVTTDNPVNYYLTSTVDKTHHGPVIASFSVFLFEMSSALLLAMREVP